MLPWWSWLIIFGAPSLLVAIITAAVVHQRKVTAQLRHDVGMRGWTLTEKVDWHKNRNGHPFNFGHSKRSRNGIDGRHGRRAFQAFQYQCNTSGDKGQQHVHTYTVLLYPMDSTHAGVRIKRRHLGHRIMALFGKAPKATGNELFDKKWVAKRTDKEAPIRIDTPIQQVVMRSPKLCWVWQGEDLMVYRRGGLRLDRLDWMQQQAESFRQAAGDADW